MTIEKLEALVYVMTNDQYNRFQSAVLNLINDNGVFTTQEIRLMEKKINTSLRKKDLLLKRNLGLRC
jgi:hypothetical protein